ncbi:LytR/AlgR family response regulator transcription factor [Candidatus Enterococcus mansonii]|uniref:Response regulator n=1 Tax=Candidatus Enterococcus mansonii TaxID=1834181 RepID=A0A242CCN4_9ENTE|nr:LytTR family DNA-binding domain-containing protein [Enterococcus sp. 4G2_DIV0659]OTO07956.1 hypothetical protein A5880_002226 [Enterococcus sp. 4G2_DIV0659]
MLSIYVCEDNPKQLENLTTAIKNYILMKDYDLEFALATADPQEILTQVKERQTIGLYFLDVDLCNEMTGIGLAVELRKLDTAGKIVFFTTHAELSYLTFSYKVEAMDYIAKDDPNAIRKIEDCIDVGHERYLNDLNPNKSFFQIKSGEKVIKLNKDEILFFESSSTPHKVVVHLENRQIEFYGTIKELAERDRSFYRCHQSFVINLNNIAEVKKAERVVIMKNGETCFVSTRYLKKLLGLIDQK